VFDVTTIVDYVLSIEVDITAVDFYIVLVVRYLPPIYADVVEITGSPVCVDIAHIVADVAMVVANVAPVVDNVPVVLIDVSAILPDVLRYPALVHVQRAPGICCRGAPGSGLRSGGNRGE
jgi:hypothetical protein